MSLGIKGIGPPKVLKKTSLGEQSMKDRVEGPTVGPGRGVWKWRDLSVNIERNSNVVYCKSDSSMSSELK